MNNCINYLKHTVTNKKSYQSGGIWILLSVTQINQSETYRYKQKILPIRWNMDIIEGSANSCVSVSMNI